MKRDWKKECDNLGIPWEVIDGEIYLWPQFRKSAEKPYGLEPYTLRQVYREIRKYEKEHLNKQSLKEQDHTKERAKTRQMIHNNEEFPTGKVHYEDPWGHD